MEESLGPNPSRLRTQRFAVTGAVVVLWAVLLLTQNQPASYWVEFWWMFPIALGIATLVNTVGISGAALFVPFFLLVFPLIAEPLGPEQSVLLALVTESFGLTSSALAFISFGLVDRKIGLRTVAGAIPFVLLGAVLAFFVPKWAFYFLIAGALAAGVVLMASRVRRESKKECILQEEVDTVAEGAVDIAELHTLDGQVYRYSRDGWGKRFLGYGVGGVFQGMGGFGIGEIGLVSSISTGIPLRVAIGTSHIIVALTAIVASATHIVGTSLGGAAVPWNIIAMTVPAVVIGGQLAPYLAARLRPEALEIFVTGLFAALAVVLLILGVQAF